MLRKIALDDRMTEAIEKYRGLRIMRQDPWECLISFLCSLAKNIRNIQNTVENICERFGKPVSLDGRRSWTFPEPGKLSDLKALRGAKAGFRAGYIVNANSQVTEDFLNGLSSLDYPEARAKLMLLVKGVGGKVADCVLLFAYGFLQAFPVDRWIRREMCRIYFGGQKVAADKIREFAQIYFGGYAGYAQEYLFYHARLAASPEPESKEDE
jgi:N-glycosylase/DNA lyase